MAATRADYLRAMMEQVNANSNKQANASQNVAQETTNAQDKNFIDKIIGGAEEIADQTASGILGFFEGFLDLGATAIGALGDATGWYSSEPFTDWAKHDLSGELVDWKKTYLPSLWDSGVKLINGDLNGDYFSRMWNNLGNVFTGADDEQFNKDIRQDYLHDMDNFMTDNEVGQFAGGIFNSIGRMLPSIAIGNFAGASGATEAGAKLLTTGLMGGSSAGSSAVEALNDGANAGQALGYGAVSGVIEAGTEYIPWPGGNTVPGLGLKKFTVKELAKSMVEEGLEEVASDVLNPLAKMIYKGPDALKDYIDPSYYKDMAMSFTAGAISGGIMEGASMAVNKAKYSNAGINILNDYGDVVKGQMKAQADFATYEDQYQKGKLTADEYYAKVEDVAKEIKAIDEKSSDIIRRYESLDPKYQNSITDFFKDGATKASANGEQVKKTISDRMVQLQNEALSNLNEAKKNGNIRRLASENSEFARNSVNTSQKNLDANNSGNVGNYEMSQNQGSMSNLDNGQGNFTAPLSDETKAVIDQANKIPSPMNNAVENQINTEYNGGDENDFRRIQEESRRVSEKEQQLFHSGDKEIDESLRRRLSGTFERILKTRSGLSGNDYGLLENTGNFEIYKNVDAETFHDIFEICQKYLKFGEMVDLHDIKSTKDSIGYDSTINYLSSDGLSGFSITKDGDLISVFNLSDKKGWLRAISNEVKANAKTLDCYNSMKQPLSEFYSKKFGFKTASIMDYNMEYDHDNIAKNHNSPQVAFMVNTDADVETKHFTKDQYDEAKAYQMSFAENKDSNNDSNAKTQSKANDNTITINNAESISDYSKILDEQPTYVSAEETSKAAKKAYDYMSSPEQLQKDGAPNQTVTLKQAKNVANSEKAMIMDAIKESLSGSDAEEVKFKVTRTGKQDRLYAAAVNANDPVKAVAAMDSIFEDSLKNTKVYIEGKKASLYDVLDKSSIDSLTKAAHDLHEALIDDSSISKRAELQNRVDSLSKRNKKLRAKVDYFKTKLSDVRTEFSSKMEFVREIDRYNRNSEITKRQYRIDQNRFPSEFKADGTFRSIVSSLPRTNLLIDKNGKIIRISDNNGTSISSNKYMQWASNSINAIQDMVKEGSLDSFTANPILEALDTVANGANASDKHLNLEQIRSLTQAMKLLRHQLSAKAIESRVQLAEKATTINKQLSFVNNALPSVDRNINKLMSMVFGENVKMMEFGDYFTGIDGSELQASMNKLVDAKEGYYKDYFEMKEKYLQGKDVDTLKKMMKGKVTVDGHKVLKTEVLDLYMQLSDPETRALMDNVDGKKTNRRQIKFAKENYLLSYDANTFQKLESVLSADEIALAKKVFGNFYGDTQDVYRNKVRKLQIEKMGDTTMPNASDGYYPRKMSSDSTIRTNTLESLEKTMAAINPSNANVNKTRQTAQSIAVLESMDPLARADGYAGQVANELNLTYPTSDLLRMLGLNIMGEDGKTTRLQSTLGSQKTKWLRDFIASANGLELVKTDGLIKVVQKGMVTATLGFNPINAMKNTLSVFKEGYKVGAGPVIKTLLNPSSWTNNAFFKAIMETGTWKARYADGILTMEADVGWDGASGKIGKITTSPYTFWDKVTTLAEAAIDYQYIKQSNPTLSKDEIISKAVSLWRDNVNITQSTAERMAKSQSASGRVFGRDSQIVKAAWTFGSDTVAGANMFFKDVAQLYTSSRIIKYADGLLNGSTVSAEMKAYAESMKAKALSTRKGILKKRLPAAAGAMLLGAVLKYLIEELNQRVKGNKKFSDALFDGDTPAEITKNTISSFVPFVETITSAIDYNNGKMELFAFSGVEDVFKAISKLTSGKTRTGLVDLTSAIAQMAGLPVKNLYGFIVNGIVARFDPEVVVDAKNLLYGAEASSTKYSDNYDMSLYERVGETSAEVKGEIKTLYDAGYQVNPTGVYESYTDKQGNEKTVSWSDRQTMKRYYQKANARLASTMKTNSYKQLGDKERSYVINKLYKAYKQAALAKTVTKETPSDIVTALAYANYGNIGQLLSYVAQIRSLEATSTSTKKQRAVSYVNSLGLSKSERMLILRLAGYTVDDKYVISTLRSAGYSTKEATKIATA